MIRMSLISVVQPKHIILDLIGMINIDDFINSWK